MHSSNTSCNHNPIIYNITSDPSIHFPENDISSNASQLDQDHPCSPPFFNFPNSPHMYSELEDAYHQLLGPVLQQQFNYTTLDAHQNQTAPTNVADYSQEKGTSKDANNTSKVESQLAARKRGSKKDRHSKINTARGPRDRRMRLSLEVAKEFFYLQDLLGYDKASRTVDWLLKKSSSAIEELARSRGAGARDKGSSSLVMGANSASSTSDECGVVSSSHHRATEEPIRPSCKKPTRAGRKDRVERPTVARESRRKARERARERTSQKRRLISESSSTEAKLLFAESMLGHGAFRESPSAGCGASMIDDKQTDRTEGLSPDEAAVVGAKDEGLGNYSSVYNTRQWNPSMTLYDYRDSAGFSHQSEQLLEQFQFCSKPWEAYSTLD